MENNQRAWNPRSTLKASAGTRQQRDEKGEELTPPGTRPAKTEPDQFAPDRTVLAQEWQRLFSVLNVLPAIVYLKASDYTIRYANRTFRERFGDPGSDPCYQVIHGREVPCEFCSTKAVLARGRPVTWEWTYPDGQSYELFDYPFVDMDGSELVLQLAIDITRRKRAEAELENTNLRLLYVSEAERKQRLFAEGLAEAALALNSSLELAKVLDRILEQTQRVIPCNAAMVILLKGHQIQLARQRGIEPLPGSLEHLEAGISLDLAHILGAARHGGQPVLLEDVSQFLGMPVISDLDWVRSVAAVPMVEGTEVSGLIALLSDQANYFIQESLRRFEAFAAHAVLAIQNARLFEKTRKGQKQLQSLSRRLVEVQENERLTVSRELHDEAGQALTSLVIQLKLLQQSATSPDQVRACTSKLIGQVESVMANLHRLAMDLRPASLDHLGLLGALQQHSETMADQHEIRVAFEAIGIEGRIAPEVEIALYRIVQEALNNVVRHAHATRADVLLEGRGDHIVLIVEDDGQGFEPETATGPDHLGLVGMQERAIAIGGKLTIESTLRGATTLFVEVPNAYSDSDR